MAALYVSPPHSVCEEPQGCNPKVTGLDGFDALGRRYPDGSYASEPVEHTLEIPRWTEDPNDIEGRERLADAQNSLVDLLG